MMKNLLIATASIVLIGIIYYTLFYLPQQRNERIDNNQQEPIQSEKEIEIEQEEGNNSVSPTFVIHNEPPAKKDANYFEKVKKIKTEYIYYAIPLKYPQDKLPTLIIYSHGSNTTVTTDLQDQFMKDLQGYGEFFTNKGYAFAASSMHGANWGSDQAVQDMQDMISYIKNRYEIESKVNLLGFSMGGLPTFNFAFTYSKNINKIALLAPTSRDYSFNQLDSIKRKTINIWHGNQDVNVPLSLSNSLIKRNTSYGFSNMTLEILPGKSHFDIDTELKREIFRFFENG